MLPSRRIRSALPRPLNRLAGCLAAAGLLVLAAPVMALSVGELQTRSALGEQLIGTIDVRIGEGESFSPSCVVAAPPGSSEFPAVRAPSLDVQATGERQARITVRSRDRIFEPISVLRLTIGCETPLTREYVVLLDPPLVAPLPQTAAPVAAPPAPSPAAQPLPGPVTRPAPAPAASTPQASAPAPVRRPPAPAPAARAATAGGDRLTLGEASGGTPRPTAASRLAAAQAQVAAQQTQIEQLQAEKQAAAERMATLETELAAREAVLNQQLDQVRQQLQAMQLQIQQAQALTADLRESSYPRSWVYALLAAVLGLSAAVLALLMRLRKTRATESWSSATPTTPQPAAPATTDAPATAANTAATAAGRSSASAVSATPETKVPSGTRSAAATAASGTAPTIPATAATGAVDPGIEPALANQTFERLDRNVLASRIQVEELDDKADLTHAISLVDYDQSLAAPATPSVPESLDIDLSAPLPTAVSATPAPAFKPEASVETRSMAMGLDVETARECQRILGLTLSAVDDAERLMEQGKTDRAIELLRRFLASQKETGPAPWLLLLQAVRQTGQADLYEEIAAEFQQALGREAPAYDDILQSILAGGLADDPLLRRSLSERWATPQFVASVFNEVMDPENRNAALSYPRQKELLKLASDCPIEGEDRPRPTVLLLN